MESSKSLSLSISTHKNNAYDQYKNPNPMMVYNIGAHKIEIDDRFDIKQSIAQGAFGYIFSVEDKTNPECDTLVIKKIEKAFEHKLFARRTLRELKLLRLLKHENIIGIKEVLLPKSREAFEEIYIVNEFMPYDLNEIMRSAEPLSTEHHQFILYQLLRGLKFIHSANIIHRDLKPKNLLINGDCELKICDFGSAKPVMPNLKMKQTQMTDYVTTRWYRAPELLLSWNQYTTAVDMWSVGCIFAELLKRRPFFTGSETKSQVELIFEYIGTPSEEEIEQIPNERWKKLVKSLPKRKKKEIETLFPGVNPLALDLLKKFLVFNPEKRISAKDALAHPYFEGLSAEEDEPECEPLPLLEFEYESYFLTKEQLKDLTYEEILLYHFPEFQKEHFEKIKENKSIIEHVFKGAKEETKRDPFDSEDEDLNEEEKMELSTNSNSEEMMTPLMKKINDEDK